MKTFTFMKKVLAMGMIQSFLIGTILPSFAQANLYESHQPKSESYKLRKQLLSTMTEQAQQIAIQEIAGPAHVSPVSSSFLKAGIVNDLVRMIYRNGHIYLLEKPFGNILVRAINIASSKGEKSKEWEDEPIEYSKEKLEELLGYSDLKNIFSTFLSVHMEFYANQYRVDEKESRVVKDSTGKERVILPLTDEEIGLINEIHSVFKELVENGYKRVGLNELKVPLYEGPGMTEGENLFVLAHLQVFSYWQNKSPEDFGESYGYDPIGEWRVSRKEVREPTGHFPIERRLGRAIIRLGNEMGSEARRNAVVALVEHELMERGYMDALKADGKKREGNDVDKAHEMVLEYPEQQELMKLAAQVAEEIYAEEFEDYRVLKGMWQNMFEVENWSKGSIAGIFGKFIDEFYELARPSSNGYKKAFYNLYQLVKKDKGLYLQYKEQMLKLLSIPGFVWAESLRGSLLSAIPTPKDESSLESLMQILREIEEINARNKGNETSKGKKDNSGPNILPLGTFIIGAITLLSASPALAFTGTTEVLSFNAVPALVSFITAFLAAIGVMQVASATKPNEFTTAKNLDESSTNDADKTISEVLQEPTPVLRLPLSQVLGTEMKGLPTRIVVNRVDLSVGLGELKSTIDAIEEGHKVKLDIVIDHSLWNEEEVRETLTQGGIDISKLEIKIRDLELDDEGFNLGTLIEKYGLNRDWHQIIVLNGLGLWYGYDLVSMIQMVLDVNLTELTKLKDLIAKLKGKNAEEIKLFDAGRFITHLNQELHSLEANFLSIQVLEVQQ